MALTAAFVILIDLHNQPWEKVKEVLEHLRSALIFVDPRWVDWFSKTPLDGLGLGGDQMSKRCTMKRHEPSPYERSGFLATISTYKQPKLHKNHMVRHVNTC